MAKGKKLPAPDEYFSVAGRRFGIDAADREAAARLAMARCARLIRHFDGPIESWSADVEAAYRVELDDGDRIQVASPVGRIWLPLPRPAHLARLVAVSATIKIQAVDGAPASSAVIRLFAVDLQQLSPGKTRAGKGVTWFAPVSGVVVPGAPVLADEDLCLSGMPVLTPLRPAPRIVAVRPPAAWDPADPPDWRRLVEIGQACGRQALIRLLTHQACDLAAVIGEIPPAHRPNPRAAAIRRRDRLASVVATAALRAANGTGTQSTGHEARR